MKLRRLVTAAAIAAPLLTVAPAPAVAATPVRVEFTGQMQVGSWPRISGPATVVGAAGVTGGYFDTTQGYEYTTPDLCAAVTQGSAYFSVAGITGRMFWIRSNNAFEIDVTDIAGPGVDGMTGKGTAVLAADPASVLQASCDLDNTTAIFRIAGQLVLSS